MDQFADLTVPQREAVRHVEGPLLVLAGAGSGKTRVITRRVAHLLATGIPGRSILALTFTNKAAGEMRERVEALVPGAGVWIGTFHGLCARLLRQYAPLVGLEPRFTIYDQADRLRVIKAVMERLGLESMGASAERVENVLSRAKNDLRTLRPRSDVDDHIAAVAAQVVPAYEEAMRAASAVDFDDLLVHVVTILRKHPEVRATLDARYRYVLVDEYQDTNLAQYAILRALSVDHPNLGVTGDPDQSIYGWRGANLNNILEFERDFPGCKVVKLERNYRSTKKILQVADHLIRHNKRRKPKALTTENAEGPPVTLTIHGSETEEAQGVASKVVELVREGSRSFRDIAVFCRVTALTRHLEMAFRAAQIPYQIVGGVAFYERQEIKDVLAYLKLLSNPRDDLAFLRVVNMPPRGLGKVTLDRLAQGARDRNLPLLAMAREAASIAVIKEKAARSLGDFVRIIDALAALRDHPAEEVLRKLLALTGYHAHLRTEAKSEGEDRLANVDELVSAARQFDHEHPGETAIEFLEEISLASAVDRWQDDAGSVALMTLHAAKGLEFPVVFIVGLEQGLLPHARAGESGAELEEERRLFFVGITRAREELYLSHCRVREFRGQRNAAIPSPFLRELPAEALDVRDTTRSASFPTFERPRMSASAGFRLVTAADLAGRGAILTGRTICRSSGRACGSCIRNTGWAASWPSTARGPIARVGSPLSLAANGHSSWPRPACVPSAAKE